MLYHTHTKKQKERHSKCNCGYRLKQRRYPRLSQCAQSNSSYAWKAENFLLLESDRLAEGEFWRNEAEWQITEIQNRRTGPASDNFEGCGDHEPGNRRNWDWASDSTQRGCSSLNPTELNSATVKGADFTDGNLDFGLLPMRAQKPTKPCGA